MKLNNLRFLAISALITTNVYSSQIEEMADQSQVSSLHEQTMQPVASTQTVIPSEQDKISLSQIHQAKAPILTNHPSPVIKSTDQDVQTTTETTDTLEDYMENNFIFPIDEIQLALYEAINKASEKVFKKAYELNLSPSDAEKIMSEYITNLIKKHCTAAIEAYTETKK